MTHAAHPSTLSVVAWVKFHWNYMRAIFQLVGWSNCLPYLWLSMHLFGFKLCKFIGLLGIHQTMNDISLII